VGIQQNSRERVLVAFADRRETHDGPDLSIPLGGVAAQSKSAQAAYGSKCLNHFGGLIAMELHLVEGDLLENRANFVE
jgi:hypothetical protein